jgi:hypothetical protein
MLGYPTPSKLAALSCCCHYAPSSISLKFLFACQLTELFSKAIIKDCSSYLLLRDSCLFISANFLQGKGVNHSQPRACWMCGRELFCLARKLTDFCTCSRSDVVIICDRCSAFSLFYCHELCTSCILTVSLRTDTRD